MIISELQNFQDHQVVLRLTDGEHLRAKVVFVDAEYADVIVDVLETSNPQLYKNSGAAYAISAADILSAELADVSL